MSLLTLESCNKIIVRRDSKDSCYSEEMTEDLSATNIDDCCRLSPLATLSPVSRKSSGSDSAVSMEYEGELNGENSFKRRFESSPSSTMNGHISDSVLDKLTMLEEKLKKMELQLRNETQQRVALEEKVTRLEEENEKLSVLRSKAVVQLQAFSEKFFAMPEPKYISPVSTPPLQSPRLQSPRHSHMELRRFGSNSSVVSRLSGQNFNMKARYSNISL